MIFVRDHDQDPSEIHSQAAKIGYDTLLGELCGGLEAWVASGRDVRRTSVVTPQRTTRASVLDVRQRSEFVGGHVPGAINIELGSLAGRIDAVPDGPLHVMCQRGERAMTAASVLECAGRRDVTVATGGPQE